MPAWWAPSNGTTTRLPTDGRRPEADRPWRRLTASMTAGPTMAPATALLATAAAPAPAATARNRRRLSADAGVVGDDAVSGAGGAVGSLIVPRSGRQAQASGQLAEHLGQLGHARLERP